MTKHLIVSPTTVARTGITTVGCTCGWVKSHVWDAGNIILSEQGARMAHRIHVAEMQSTPIAQ